MAHHTHTLATHAGREDFREIGVHAPPLDLSTTYPVADLEEGRDSIDALAGGAGQAASPIYARLHNPTVSRYEDAFASLEGAEAGVAYASGMAAIHAVLMALRVRDLEEQKQRNHILAIRPLYGCTDHLLSIGLLGFDVDWVAADQVAHSITQKTAMVLIETPANPTLSLVDIRQVVAQAGEVPVMVDNTFATPILQQPLALGATFSVHSGTKYLGGHGDVLAGLVASSEFWAKRLRQVRILTGGNLHPMAAYLLHRSLPTLPMRVEKAQANAKDLVERLAQHPMIKQVYYPGFGQQDPKGLVGTQMSGGGSVLAIELHGSFADAAHVMRKVELFTPAVSLGSTDSLIEHPAGLTHRIVDEAARTEDGISESMLRISVGIEHAEDLWRDLQQALDSLQLKVRQPA